MNNTKIRIMKEIEKLSELEQQEIFIWLRNIIDNPYPEINRKKKIITR
jgi:hypothetical protein